MTRIHVARPCMIFAALYFVCAPCDVFAAKQAVSNARSTSGLADEPYRQCAGIFFSTETSAWFAMDCLVPADYAEVGVLTTGLLPGVGRKKLWITDVYDQPKLTPTPSFSEPPPPPAPSDAPPPPAPSDSSDPSDPSAPPAAPAPVDADNGVGSLEKRAIIELVMPAGAKLYVNDVAVDVAEGRNEVPISGLEPDAAYEYRLRLESDAKGDLPASERTIVFAAGDRVVVDLSAAPAADNVAAVDDATGSRVE